MIQYDPNVIYQFAARLYSSAQQIIITYTAIGAILGGVVGFALLRGGIMALVGAVILGGIGYALGTQRAFQLKLQAQIALCQAKIEENTRLH
jgi:hypothetical protein